MGGGWIDDRLVPRAAESITSHASPDRYLSGRKPNTHTYELHEHHAKRYLSRIEGEVKNQSPYGTGLDTCQ